MSSGAASGGAEGFEHGDTVEVGPGEAVCVQRGRIHGFRNHGDVEATFRAIATPAVFGPAYFREIGEVLAASAGGPPDLAALGEVMRRHGLTPAPPGGVCCCRGSRRARRGREGGFSPARGAW